MQKIKEKAIRFLRWTEKYTKTDMVYAGKSGFWLFSNQIFASLVSMILSIIFANSIPKEIFGSYKYILSIAGLGVAFTLSGMNTAVTQAVAQGREGTFRGSIMPQLKWSIFAALFSLAASAYYLYQSNPVYALCFLIIAIVYPVSSVSNTYNAYLQGKKDFKTSAIYGFWSNVIYFVILGAAILFSGKLIVLVAAYYISTAGANLLFLWRTSRKISASSADSKDISFGRHLSFMNSFSVIAGQIDSVLVYLLLGPADLAIYSFAIILPDRIRLLFSPISTAALPKIAERKDFNTRSILKKLVPFFGAMIAIIGAYVIFAPLIYKIFYPEYIASVNLTQVYSITMLGTVALLATQALYAKKMQKELYSISIVGPILKIILTVIFIYAWGLWGAIIARLVSYMFYTAMPIGYLFKKSSE